MAHPAEACDEAEIESASPVSPTPESTTPTCDLPTLIDPGRPAFLHGPEPSGEPEDELLASGDWIGPYHLLRLLGEGGFGTVYLAEQTEPLRRQVALKLLRGGRDRRLLRRFEVERQALARMSHPNVAQVFAAGTSPDGRPYIALEYVPGVPITRACDEHRLSLTERLEIFAAVCDGVQHAHQKAVLHRDLKPSNILVTESAGKLLPKIIDFGIAKALDHPLALTRDHTVVGTVAYLSPEAIEQGGDLDTRSDVYSLGVVLYELLAGGSPFRRSSDRALMNRIVAGDVEKPSAFLAGLEPEAREVLADRRRTEVSALRRALRGDLDAIVLKAMARERAQRYGSAAELAADIRRHLANEPVIAVPPGALYQARKFARRHRSAVAAGLLSFLALAGAFTATTLEARRANREAERANREAERANREADTAQEVVAFLAGLFEEARPGTERDLTARQILDRGVTRMQSELSEQPLVKARLLATTGDLYRTLGQYPRSESLLREALALQRQHLEAGDPEIAWTLQALAELLRESGQSREVGPVIEEALAIYREHGDPDDLVPALVELASFHHQHARYTEAEPLLLQALALREEQRGPGHERVSPVLNNLGNLYYDMRRFEDAERVQKRALLIKERNLGPDHPYVAQSLNNLANVYMEQGRLEEAERLHRQALEIKLKAFEPGHIEIGVSYNNLADIAVRRGLLEEGAELYRKALATWDLSLPADHPHRAYALQGLANVERDLGDSEAAAELYRRALAIAEARLDPAHPLVVEIRGDAGMNAGRGSGTPARP